MPPTKRKRAPSPDSAGPARNLRTRKAKQADPPTPAPRAPRPRVKSKATKQRNKARKVRSAAEANRTVVPAHRPEHGVKKLANCSVLPPLTHEQGENLAQHLHIAMIHSPIFNQQHHHIVTRPLWTAVLRKLCGSYLGVLLPATKIRVTASKFAPGDQGQLNQPQSKFWDQGSGNSTSIVQKHEITQPDEKIHISSDHFPSTNAVNVANSGTAQQDTHVPRTSPSASSTSVPHGATQDSSTPTEVLPSNTLSSENPPPNLAVLTVPEQQQQLLLANCIDPELAEYGARMEVTLDYCVILSHAVVRNDINIKETIQSRGYEMTNSGAIPGIIAEDEHLWDEIFTMSNLQLPLLVGLNQPIIQHPENIENYVAHLHRAKHMAERKALEQMLCLFSSDDYEHQDEVTFMATFGDWWLFCEMTRGDVEKNIPISAFVSPLNEGWESESDESDYDDGYVDGKGKSTKAMASRAGSFSKATLKKLDGLNDKAVYPYSDVDLNQCFNLLGISESQLVNNDEFHIDDLQLRQWTPCMRIGSAASNQGLEYIAEKLDRLGRLEEEYFLEHTTLN